MYTQQRFHAICDGDLVVHHVCTWWFNHSFASRNQFCTYSAICIIFQKDPIFVADIPILWQTQYSTVPILSRTDGKKSWAAHLEALGEAVHAPRAPKFYFHLGSVGFGVDLEVPKNWIGHDWWSLTMHIKVGSASASSSKQWNLWKWRRFPHRNTTLCIVVFWLLGKSLGQIHKILVNGHSCKKQSHSIDIYIIYTYIYMHPAVIKHG